MLRAYRGRVLHFWRDPGDDAAPDSYEYLADGLVVVRDGIIERTVDAGVGLKQLQGEAEVVDYTGRWIVPGFVDCHVHYPQIDMIGAFGKRLLDWLQAYTYPAEARFADHEHASATAEFFLDELLRQGTTTALVFATVHAQSAQALFVAARKRNMRLITGKVLMDRHCPAELCDTPESGYAESRQLIEQWHGEGRLHYAITPRFAPTSSAAQLRRAGTLAAEYPDVYVHTHLAETQRESSWVRELFAGHRSYLDVYAHYGLARERSVFAHCLHLDEQDWRHMRAARSSIAFCPSSNLFLGSGLFDLQSARAGGIPTGLGTDIGAGTSLSLLRTLGDAYKVCQIRAQNLAPWQALYLATLGGAEALRLDDKIGNFASGSEADLVIINPGAVPLTARRDAAATDHWDALFSCAIMADDRLIEATYVAGERQ